MAEIESKDQDTDEGKITTSWLRELSLASTHEEKWRKRAKKVIDRYRDEASEDEDNRKSRFNILFSNTEVLRGVIYQKTPNPDVRRRFLDKDPAGRDAAQVLQRVLSYCADSYDFDGVMAGVVEDYLLPGRGVAKIKYIPSYAPMHNEETGEPLMDAESGEPVQEVIYETVETEYVEWEMFRMSPAKRWSKVRWVAFGELLTRDELKAQFGDKGSRCTLDWKPKAEEEDDMFKRALVWSIWDKTSKKVHVVCKGLPGERLAVKDDPLNLEQFFPCPKPVYSIHNTNSMIPIPEYAQYQDQALELDNLTARIEALTDSLRRRGVYDASYPELQKLASAGDDEFVPIEKFMNLAEKGGIAAALYESPIEGIAKVMIQLMEQRDAVKQIIYEVTGIADIVRGVSNSSETLGAQELKARYANSRTGPRQKDIQIFARDLYRLKAEIISEKFSPKTLATMTGFDFAQNDMEKQALATQAQAMAQAGQQTIPPESLNKPTWEQITQILQSDKLRGFRVDIETDSTVMPDAATEQQNRIELLTAISQFVTGIAPAVQSGAIPMDLAKEMLTFGVRAFKVSPQLEDALDSIGGGSEQSAQAQQQMQMQQQQLQQQTQQAQQMIADQQKQAEAVIQQAKDAKHQQELQAVKTQSQDQVKSAMEVVNQREAMLAQREAELAVEKQTQDAIRQLQSIVDGFTQQLNATASAESNDGESNKPDQMAQMQEMHNQVMQMFAQLVEKITAPRYREAVRKNGQLIGSIETTQTEPKMLQ
jgi:hypothetical protein